MVLTKKLDALKMVTHEHLFKMLCDNDDRACILAASAFLDDHLAVGISFAFDNHPSNTEAAKLFEGFGPLSSFSSKIAVAYHIGAIEGLMKNDLTAIRNIRNLFAHSYADISFERADVMQEIQKLRISPSMLPRIEKGAKTKSRLSVIKSVCGIYVGIRTYAIMKEAKRTVEKERLEDLQRAFHDLLKSTI